VPNRSPKWVLLRPNRTLSRCLSFGLVLLRELTFWRARFSRRAHHLADLKIEKAVAEASAPHHRGRPWPSASRRARRGGPPAQKTGSYRLRRGCKRLVGELRPAQVEEADIERTWITGRGHAPVRGAAALHGRDGSASQARGKAMLTIIAKLPRSAVNEAIMDALKGAGFPRRIR
jgi:hypothetical protein